MPPECRQCGIRHSDALTCDGMDVMRPLGDAYFGISDHITRHVERLREQNRALSQQMDAIEIRSFEEANRVFGVPTRPPYPLDTGVHVVVDDSNNTPTTIERGEMHVTISIDPANANGDHAVMAIHNEHGVQFVDIDPAAIEAQRISASIYALICDEIANRCGVPREFLEGAKTPKQMTEAIKKFRQQQEDQMLPTDVFSWL